MARDLIVGTTSGYTLDQLKYWLHSLERTGCAAERVVFVGNGDEALVDGLETQGCRVVRRTSIIEAPRDGRGLAPFADRDMCVERYFLLWKYLSTVSGGEDVRYVVSVDMRDAVFQSDPVAWLAAHLRDKRLVVSSEGLAYADEPWNRASMDETFPGSVAASMRSRLVWNCGTIGGERTAMRDLALNLYLLSRTVAYADQASLNVLLSLSPYADITLFDRGDLGWACQAATMVRTARGPERSSKFQGTEPLFDGDTAFTSAGRPFCIVHQYDRVPHWKVALERKFA